MGWQFLLLVRSRPEEGTQTRAEAAVKAPYCPTLNPGLGCQGEPLGAAAGNVRPYKPQLWAQLTTGPRETPPPPQEPWLWPAPGSLGYSPVTLAGLKF